MCFFFVFRDKVCRYECLSIKHVLANLRLFFVILMVCWFSRNDKSTNRVEVIIFERSASWSVNFFPYVKQFFMTFFELGNCEQVLVWVSWRENFFVQEDKKCDSIIMGLGENFFFFFFKLIFWSFLQFNEWSLREVLRGKIDFGRANKKMTWYFARLFCFSLGLI